MDEKQGDISSDSDFGDSWTIIDKHSFCNRMMDAINVFEEYSDLSNNRDCALNFQDDSNNDADADSDGISVISESEDHHTLMDPEFSYTPTLHTKLPTPPSSPEPNECFDTLETNIRTIQAGTRTPKKNKAKCNKPLTPPNTPVDCECSEKPEKKHKKKSYIHNRNDKVSNILNILLAGTIATAAGLALGHLMGSKSECSNLTAGVNNELTLKQLQYENYKLKNELQDLKRESIHINNRFNKYSANSKSRRNMTNNGIPNLTKNNSNNDYNLEQNLKDNNTFPSSQSKSVFYGPKTYAETITYQRQKFDDFCDETNLINIPSTKEFENKNLDGEKSISVSDIPRIEEIVSVDEPIQDHNKTARIQSFPNLQHKSDTENVKNTNQTSDNKEKQSVSENHKSNKKNSKTRSNTGPKDLKYESENIAQSKNEKTSKSNNKLKRKSNNKDCSSCKKSRSNSSGKESGDFNTSKLSSDENPNEKTGEPENEKIQDDIGLEQQQYKNRKSQKCAKKDHKQKDKAKNKKLVFEYESKINEKNGDDKHDKYPENESFQKYKTEQKKYNKKDKKDVNKNDQPLSDIKSTGNKDKKNTDKFLKSHQKDDRRKSDYKHESKDKYEDWEKNKGYEYYLSQDDDILLDGLSEDESYNKADKYPSDKTMFSSEDSVYPKINAAKGYKDNNIVMNDFDSQNNNWSFLPLAETSDTNSDKMDSSWVEDIAKYREEQRNKQKESDWLFERAKIREMKRDKASWYFNRMNEREQCRAQEKDKHTSKRSNKKSPNYRSKL